MRLSGHFRHRNKRKGGDGKANPDDEPRAQKPDRCTAGTNMVDEDGRGAS
ncbi:MAG: hypothetical protein ACJ780_01970 [Solirubrobacteraceae bacterium]